MKMMKWALLGGAAFAVMTTSAQADELSALKAQLEALQSRVTQLEAQPATSMPSGFSLLSIRDGGQAAIVAERQQDKIDPNSGITISILPAADVAPAAEISVSGEIRTLLVYDDNGFHEGDDFLRFNEDGVFEDAHGDGSGHLDVQARGRLVVQGKVDTAVGEVGARIRLQGGNPFDTHNANRLTEVNQAYGWWKFGPNWQLIAGLWDTTAAIQSGVDWDFTLGATGGPSDKNVEQMRLVFGGEGPFSFAIAVEDTDDAFTAISDSNSCNDFIGEDEVPDCREIVSEQDRGQYPAIAGYIMYNNDNLMFQVAGVFQDDQFGENEDWGVGAGTRIGLGDMFQLTAAGIYAEGYNGYSNDLSMGEDDTFWAVSAGIIFNIAEATRFELGGGYEDVEAEHSDFFSPQPFDKTVWTITGGVYWDPVSQVTLGLQANYQDFQADVSNDAIDASGDQNDFQVRFGTWLRFP
jgi:hypothetical protein